MMTFRLPGLALIGLTLGLSLSGGALADRVQVPVGQQSGEVEAGSVPTNGMTQTRVEERFGEPQEKREPVGDPPISSWIYEDYIVYFEHDRVLRSVLKHRPRGEAGDSTTNDG